MYTRLLAIVLVTFAAFALPRSARAAYSEWHYTGSDARVIVDRDAKAVVEQRLSVRVVAGTLRSLSLTGYGADAMFEAEGKVTSDDGGTFALAVGRDGDTYVQAMTQDALKRGDYVFVVRYHLDLAQGHLSRDGVLQRLTVMTPPLPEGVDGVRVVFDLPAAPTEPRIAAGAEQAGVLATLRRSPDRDELELVRPHISRGEALSWTIRVDPLALAARLAAAPRALPPAALPVDRSALIALLAGLIFGCVALLKRASFARVCAGAGAEISGLRPSLLLASSTLACAAAIYARLSGMPVIAGACVALTIAVTMLRAIARPTVRGPGQWVMLRPRDVFAPVARVRLWPAGAEGDAFDARSPRGRRVVALLTVIASVSAMVLSRRGADAADLPLLLLAAHAGLFFSGTRADLLPDAARNASALRGVFDRLSRAAQVKVSPRARLPMGSQHPDEVRLLVMPRAPMPGVFGVEVAAAWEQRGGSFVPAAEVLVRVQGDSPASAKMASRHAGLRPLAGRKPEERVFRFEAEWPTEAAIAALASDLAALLMDRRMKGEFIYEGSNRRAAREAIAATSALAAG